MDSCFSAQASETPFNISDYVNFDFDFEHPLLSTGSVVEHLRDMSIEDPMDISYPALEDRGVADASQSSVAAVFEPMPVVDTVDPAVLMISTSLSKSILPPTLLETKAQLPASEPASIPLTQDPQREPSRWTLVSPELQVQLNTMYASQLAQLASDPNPPSALFVPAGEQAAFLVSGLQSLESGMRQQFSNVKESSNNKRALDTTNFDDEPLPKRSRIAQSKALIDSKSSRKSVPDDGSDDDSDSRNFSCPTQSLQPAPSLPREALSSPPRSSALTGGPTWRYEQKHEARLREQRREQYNRRRANGFGVGSKALNRRMQKLRREIEDTREFVEARGCEVGEVLRRRPLRKGARKSYVGLE